MDRDHYLSDDDEDFHRPPPIPSGQISNGANPRLPPTVQQLPDPRARTSSGLSENYFRLRGQRFRTDDGTRLYVDQWGNSYTQRPPDIRSNRTIVVI